MWQKIRLLTGDRMSNRLLEGKSPDDEEDYQDDAECEVTTRRLMEMMRRIVTMTNVSIWPWWRERLETNLSELRVNCCNSPQVLPLPGLQVQLYTFNEIILRICIVIISLQLMIWTTGICFVLLVAPATLQAATIIRLIGTSTGIKSGLTSDLSNLHFSKLLF